MDTNRSNGNDDYDDDGDGGDNVEYDDGDNVEYDGRDNAEYDGGDDNFTVEDDVEADAQDDQIPENHYKMVAFQTAIQAVLERQIEKLQLEVNENARLVTIGTKESQEAAKHLHDEQKCLVLEEDNVRSAAERLDRTQSRRERREKENRDYRAEVERSEADLEQRIVHNEQLRAEVNDLTGQSLRYQLRRLEVEGEVGVDQACSDKGEQDFKVAQEAKQFQDKYIGKRVGDRRCGDRAPPQVSWRRRWSSWRAWRVSTRCRRPPWTAARWTPATRCAGPRRSWPACGARWPGWSPTGPTPSSTSTR